MLSDFRTPKHLLLHLSENLSNLNTKDNMRYLSKELYFFLAIEDSFQKYDL